MSRMHGNLPVRLRGERMTAMSFSYPTRSRALSGGAEMGCVDNPPRVIEPDEPATAEVLCAVPVLPTAPRFHIGLPPARVITVRATITSGRRFARPQTDLLLGVTSDDRLTRSVDGCSTHTIIDNVADYKTRESREKEREASQGFPHRLMRAALSGAINLTRMFIYRSHHGPESIQPIPYEKPMILPSNPRLASRQGPCSPGARRPLVTSSKPASRAHPPRSVALTSAAQPHIVLQLQVYRCLYLLAF